MAWFVPAPVATQHGGRSQDQRACLQIRLQRKRTKPCVFLCGALTFGRWLNGLGQKSGIGPFLQLVRANSKRWNSFTQGSAFSLVSLLWSKGRALFLAPLCGKFLHRAAPQPASGAEA